MSKISKLVRFFSGKSLTPPVSGESAEDNGDAATGSVQAAAVPEKPQAAKSSAKAPPATAAPATVKAADTATPVPAAPATVKAADTAANTAAPVTATASAPMVGKPLQYKHQLSRGVVRIFLSSPFNGLEEEREELRRTYIPQWHDMCHAAGLQLGIVDMRWGITTEMSQRNETINVCLSEVDRSDIFVGFYAQRYGWHGEQDPVLQKTFDLAQSKFPFINQFRDRSVTELEFLHGHLNEPSGMPAVFVFRDKAYDDAQLRRVEESSDPETKAKAYFYRAESAHSTMRLDDLKMRVANSSTEFHHPAYATPAEGAKMMFDAVVKILRDVYHIKPLDTANQSMVQRELLAHQTFRDLRANSSQYVGGDRYLSAVDAIIARPDGTEPQTPVVVKGAAGSGKSMLLANWTLHFAKKQPDAFVFYHFIGASQLSTDLQNVLKRLLHGLAEALQSSAASEMDKLSVAQLRGAVAQLLSEAHERKVKVVLVLDGLDLLDASQDADRVHSMRWWPTELPSSARQIVSCLAQSPFLEALKGGDRVDVVPLTEDEKLTFLRDQLRQQSKTLLAGEESTLVASASTGNALFLQIIVWELLSHSDFKTIGDRINDLLTSQSIMNLFDKVLTRYERDYADVKLPNAEANVIATFCRLVHSSRNGLTEDEIVAILGIDQTEWLTVYYALRPYLIVRQTVVSFAFEPMRQAIEQRYFAPQTDEAVESPLVAEIEASVSMGDQWLEQITATLKPFLSRVMGAGASPTVSMTEVRLAFTAYLFTQLDATMGANVLERALEQLPWLLTQSRRFNTLAQLLVHPAFVLRYATEYPSEIIQCWNAMQLDATTIGQLYKASAAAYLPTQTLEQQMSFCDAMGSYFALTKNATVSFHFLKEAEQLADRVFSNKADESYLSLLNRIATVLVERSEFENAKGYHDRVLKVRAEAPVVKKYLASEWASNAELRDPMSVVRCEASGYAAQVRERMLKEWSAAERAALTSYADSIGNIAVLMLNLQLYDDALDYMTDSLVLRRLLLHPETSRVIADDLNNVGAIYMAFGKNDVASAIYKDALALYDRMFLGSANEDVGGTLLNLGVTLRRMGNHAGALEQLQRALEVRAKTVGMQSPDYAEVLQNLGVLYQSQRNDDQARRYYSQALEIQRRALGPRDQKVGFNHENVAMTMLSSAEPDVVVQGVAHARAALAILQELWLTAKHRDVLSRQGLPPPFFDPATVPARDKGPAYYGSSMPLRLSVARRLAGPMFNRSMEAAGWAWTALPAPEGYELLYDLYRAYREEGLANLQDVVELQDDTLDGNLQPLFPPMPNMLDGKGLLALMDEALQHNPGRVSLLDRKAMALVITHTASATPNEAWLSDLLAVMATTHSPGTFSSVHQLLEQGLPTSPEHRDVSVAVLEAGCAEFPDDVILVYNLASTQYKIRDYAKAEASFRKVLELDDGDLSAKLQLSLSMIMQGNVAPARSLLDDILQIIPATETANQGAVALRAKAVEILQQLDEMTEQE